MVFDIFRAMNLLIFIAAAMVAAAYGEITTDTLLIVVILVAILFQIRACAREKKGEKL